MAFPSKGWPKYVGRNLKKKGGNLLMFGKAWRPQNIEMSKRRRLRYRDGLVETSRDPPLTRSAMTRRQIAWIVNHPEKRTYPCYDIYCNDETRSPRLDPETERLLLSPHQEQGVSVTISGHRFIALSTETSWIDKCKGCGNIDAVEFITRCGAHKFCRRVCVQAFVQHRRYRRQILQRPLFTRPHSMRSGERLPEEEIVLNEKPIRVKRKYTKRKNVAKSDIVKTSGDDGKKREKRAYKKREKHTPKLKVKMQLDKVHRDLQSSKIESICHSGHRDVASSIANVPSSPVTDGGLSDGNDQRTTDETIVGNSGQEERASENTTTTVTAVEKLNDSTEIKHRKTNTIVRDGPLKLGNVKIVLTKCAPEKIDEKRDHCSV